MRSGSRSRTTVLPFPFAFVLTFVFSLAFSLLSAFLSSFASAFAFAFVPMGGSARGTRLVGRIPRSPRMWGLVGIIATALRCPLWSPPTWLLGIAFLSLSLLPLNQRWADESVLETAFVAISFGAIAVFPVPEAVTSWGIADFGSGWLLGSGTRLASSFWFIVVRSFAFALVLTLPFVAMGFDEKVGIGIVDLSLGCFIIHTNIFLDALAVKVLVDVLKQGLAGVLDLA